MKQIYYFSITALFTVNFLQAQPTLTSFNNPAPGEDYIVKYCVASGINFALAGNNYTWNFSSVIYSPTTTTYNYILPSATGWAATFSTSTLARKEATLNNYVFYSANSTLVQVDGEVQGASVQIKYDDKELFMIYPFTYQNVVGPDSFYATYQANSIIYNRKGSNVVEADGWGQLILPNITIDSVLRVKQTETIFDSTTFASNYKRFFKTNYFWYKKNEKFPVFYVTRDSTVIGGSSNPAQQSVYISNDYSIGFPENFSNSVSVSVYPNPAGSNRTIVYEINDAADVSISCVGLAGQKIFELPQINVLPGIFEKKIELPQLDKGVYILLLNAGGKKSEVKISVE